MQKVLVVEDSIVVNKHISALLASNNIDVCSAFNTTDALKQLKQFQPDLVLLDIMMERPDSGLELARNVDIKNSGIPIIFLTALTDQKTIEEIKKVSPYGYITKPFNEVELVTNVDVAISKSKAESELRANYEYNEAVFNVIGSAIIVCDEDMRIINFNRSFAELTGMHANDFFKYELQQVFRLHEYASGQRLRSINQVNLLDYYDAEVINPKSEESARMCIGNIEVRKVSSRKGFFNIVVFTDAKDRIEKERLEKKLRVKDMSQLLLGQESERRRISAELHDNLSQILNSAKLALKTNKEDYAIEMLSHALDETRRISENLLPSKLVDFSLEKSITSYIRKLEKVVDFSISFYHDNLPEIEDELAKVHIFRVLQEALNNASKYSECKQVSIQLIGEDENLIFSVEDDGRGFDLGSIGENESNGMKNMQYRAELLGTELEIESQQGKGTFISLKIPFFKLSYADSTN